MKRFSRLNPCPVCGGWESKQRGRSERCFGFLSDDCRYAHCTREEFAGDLGIIPDSSTFAHLLHGKCRCGVQHGSTRSGGRANDSAHARIVATYCYRDANKKVLSEVVRMEPKAFKQRRPDGMGGWIWKLNGVRRVLYRLPELLAADRQDLVFVVEGEKDADNLVSLGLTATTNPGGAGKWRSQYSEVLRGRNVVLLPDNDKPGRSHMEDVARSLTGLAHSVKLISLPNLPQKGDVSDWLKNGGTMDMLTRLVAAAEEYKPEEQAQDTNTPKTTGKIRSEGALDAKDANFPTGKIAQVDQLIRLASDAEMFHVPDSEAYATFPVNGHHETWRIRDRAFNDWLVHRYFRETGRVPNAQAMNDALRFLQCRSRYEGRQHDVYVRVGRGAEAIYLDLANEAWQVVEIKAEGWRLVDRSPIKFRRSDGMLSLPTPQRGGNLDELLRFINLGELRDERLVVGWLLACLRPIGPYPVLVLHGEHGSAKSTAAKVLRFLVDPNVAPLRAEPREPRDLAIAAGNGWIIGLDNLSSIKPWLSDALCRLATGGGFSTRELYSDDHEKLFYSQRPIVLNGIEELATRPDLVDRAILLYLPPISEEMRRARSDFWADLGLARPRILGALLTVIAGAMKDLGSVRLDRSPRMADFAIWVTAAERSLGWSAGKFMDAYMGNRADANSLALEASPITIPLRALAEDGEWEGTATDLLKILQDRAGGLTNQPPDWPKNGRVLSGRLRQIAPNLRASGIGIRFGKSGRRFVTVRKIAPTTPTASGTAECSTLQRTRMGLSDAELDANNAGDDSTAISRDALDAPDAMDTEVLVPGEEFDL
jgi:hypothetical protein